MANYGARYNRENRRTGPQRVAMATRVSPELAAKADRVAEAHNISLSALLAELVARMETDSSGRLPGPLLTFPQDDDERGQLPGLGLTA